MNELWTLVEEPHPANSASLIEACKEDRERAPHLLCELLAEPPAVRCQMAVTLVRFRSVALVGLLVERSLDQRAEGEEPAALALAILGVLDRSWSVLIDQGRARAWGALADVYRLKGDFVRAEKAAFRARCHLSDAPDPLEEAHFYRMCARLLRDRGVREGAIEVQRRAVRNLSRFAVPQLAAEALVELAELHLDAGDRAQTLTVLHRAREVLRWN